MRSARPTCFLPTWTGSILASSGGLPSLVILRRTALGKTAGWRLCSSSATVMRVSPEANASAQVSIAGSVSSARRAGGERMILMA